MLGCGAQALTPGATPTQLYCDDITVLAPPPIEKPSMQVMAVAGCCVTPDSDVTVAVVLPIGVVGQLTAVGVLWWDESTKTEFFN